MSRPALSRHVHRRVPPTALLLALLAALIPSAGSVAAAPMEACSPTPKVASSFCITTDVSVNTTSSAPAKLAFELANTSTETTSPNWLSALTVAIAPTTAGAFGITPSSAMPHGLVVAGSTSCTSPAFTDCVGSGAAKISVSGFAAGHYDGTFGVRRIINVNPPPEGVRAHYAGIIDMCLPYGGNPCQIPLEQQFTISVPEVSGAEPLSFSFPVRFSGTVPGGNYDAAVHTFEMAISGASNQVYNGSEVEPTTMTRVLSTPQTCGAVTGTVTGSTAETVPRVVMTEHSQVITRCPVARFVATPEGFKASFDGSASSAFDPRTVTRWFWDFGDGTTKTTTTPSVTHPYDSDGPHTATLSVRDSAGARSAVVTRTVKGTATTVGVTKSPTAVTVAGGVTPNHSGHEVLVLLDRLVGDAFDNQRNRNVTLDGTSRYATSFGRLPAGTCRIRVVFAGDNDHLGSRAAKEFAC